jgi:hypothetical protein
MFEDDIRGEQVRQCFEIPPIDRGKVFLHDSIRLRDCIR